MTAARYPLDHWSYNPYQWDTIDVARQIDSGVLFCPGTEHSRARSSVARAFQAAFGKALPPWSAAELEMLRCDAIFNEKIASVLNIAPNCLFGVVNFRTQVDGPCATIMHFTLRFYRTCAVFSAALIANPVVPFQPEAAQAFDAFFAHLAGDRLWQWDRTLRGPVRRSPHLSWFHGNKDDRDLTRDRPIACSLLAASIPPSFTREEEEAFSRRLHTFTVGRIPVMNLRPEESEADGKDAPRAPALSIIRDHRLCPGWSSDAEPTICLPHDPSDEDIRAAIIDLRNTASDFTAAAYPSGMHARISYDVLVDLVAAETPPAIEPPPPPPVDEMASLRQALADAEAKSASLQVDLDHARAARDRFKGMVGDLRERVAAAGLGESPESEALDGGGGAPVGSEPAPFGSSPSQPSGEATVGSPSPEIPPLPEGWRDPDTLLAWIHAHYGSRIVFHQRVRASLADAPPTVDEAAIADILDILGRDYLPLMDGDRPARNRYLERTKRYKIGKGISASGAGIVRGYEFVFEGERIDPRHIRKIRERGRSMAGRAVCVYFTPLHDGRLLIVALPRHLQTLDS